MDAECQSPYSSQEATGIVKKKGMMGYDLFYILA
jgi:hypothetical protein